jgi:hypothetical protein
MSLTKAIHPISFVLVFRDILQQQQQQEKSSTTGTQRRIRGISVCLEPVMEKHKFGLTEIV